MSRVLQVFMMLLTLGMFTSAYAACSPMVNTYTEDFMAELQEKVELSPEQQAAMEEIMRNGINAREDVIDSYQGQKGLRVKKSMRDELQAANATTRSEVQEVLNEEQYKAFLEVQDQTQEKVRERINRDF